jgi:thiol-disulfide isomerase/thioredoxin
MRTIQRLTTLGMFLLTSAVTFRAAPACAQDPDPYAEQMQQGDVKMERHLYQDALQAYRHAFAISKKSSPDAAVGMAMAYRALGAYKNVLDISGEALQLAGTGTLQQATLHNLRGAALVALSDKPKDKRLEEAEAEFRTALASNHNLYTAQLNLGTTLLKMERDEEGVRELKAYVERAPKGSETADALKMIEDPRRARETFAPDFSFTSSEGEYIALDDLKGKTVFLDFWGSWCGPCVRATPAMINLHKKFAAQPVVFLGIAQDSEESWRAYLDKHHMDWPQFLDAHNQIIGRFNVRGYPTFIILDGDGIIRARANGYSSGIDRWIESEINKTLQKKE